MKKLPHLLPCWRTGLKLMLWGTIGGMSAGMARCLWRFGSEWVALRCSSRSFCVVFRTLLFSLVKRVFRNLKESLWNRVLVCSFFLLQIHKFFALRRDARCILRSAWRVSLLFPLQWPSSKVSWGVSILERGAWSLVASWRLFELEPVKQLSTAVL